MTAYCDHTDVGILLDLTFDEVSSKPRASKVITIIELISSEVNLALMGSGITLPTVGTDLYNIVKLKTMQGSAGLIGITYYGNDDKVVGTRGEYFRQEYLKFINDIQNKPELFMTSVSSLVIGNQVTNGTETEESISDVLIGNDLVS